MKITTDGEDHEKRRLQREVLALGMVEHPLPTTVRELQRALGRPPEVERAIEALAEYGLLGTDGETVVPTAAAIRFNEFEPIEPPGGPC